MGQDPIATEAAKCFGLCSVSQGGVLFCGVTAEAFEIDGVTYKWPVTEGLTWSLQSSRLGAIGEQDLKAMYAQIFDEIAQVIDFRVEYTHNWRTANFLLAVVRLDGRGGTLAQHGIPMPHFRESDQLVGQFDDSEIWDIFDGPRPGKIDARRVGRHEILHGFGLGHGKVDPQNPALIEPRYSEHVWDFQERDKAELLRRYRPAKPASPPAPLPPAPAAGDKLVVEELRIAVGGKRFKLSGAVGPMQMVAEE